MGKAWMLLGLLALPSAVLAEEGRYQAFPLSGGDAGRSGARAFIIDSRDGHVWVWSENELIVAPDGRRRYGAGFLYQGRLRPGTQPGELLEQQAR